eukprot:evm.model.scf_47.8 EVM.evm.TU.scf_47.8   scf_47:93889-98668(-)
MQLLVVLLWLSTSVHLTSLDSKGVNRANACGNDRHICPYDWKSYNPLSSTSSPVVTSCEERSQMPDELPQGRTLSQPGDPFMAGLERETTVQAPTFRLKNGTPAPKGRFPWMVSIRDSSRMHICGGILIDRQYVLTAAHCVDEKNGIGKNGIVHISPHATNDDEKKRGVVALRIARTCIFPGWEGNIQSGVDLALLQLPKRVHVKTPSLAEPGSTLRKGTPVYALGWGLNKIGNLPPELQMATDLILADKDRCPYRNAVAPHLLCAYARTQDTCRGDSGGPLLQPDMRFNCLEEGNPSIDLILGVVSSGGNCSDDGSAGLYTRVDRYRDWMTDVMSGKVSPEYCMSEVSVPVL